MSRRRIAIEVPLWRPYLRITPQSRYSKPALAYHQSSKALADVMRLALRMAHPELAGDDLRIRSPYRVAVQVWISPVKSKPGQRPRLTCNGQDWDNYWKAAVDAAAYHGIVDGDAAGQCIGPSRETLSGIFATPKGTERGVIVIEEVDDLDYGPAPVAGLRRM